MQWKLYQNTNENFRQIEATSKMCMEPLKKSNLEHKAGDISSDLKITYCRAIVIKNYGIGIKRAQKQSCSLYPIDLDKGAVMFEEGQSDK